MEVLFIILLVVLGIALSPILFAIGALFCLFSGSIFSAVGCVFMATIGITMYKMILEKWF